MKRIDTIIVGAGQAGLAMSRCLSDRSIAHVVIERGEIANSWRHERWDSLRLLTPNWQSRLPGFSYSGAAPDGFMTMPQVAGYLGDYADASRAPVECRTSVFSAEASGSGYHVATSRGDWHCANLVIATGACAIANVPALSAAVPEGIAQLTPTSYRCPDQLRPGGVMIVGGSATGVQLASEIRAAGHAVTLCVGEHIRAPRHYRGRDIQWWMDRAGILTTTADEVDDIARARRVPSLQLVGSYERQFLDLNALQADGVEIAGRLVGINDGLAQFSGGLANFCALSDLKMNRLLTALDAWAQETGIPDLAAPERFAPTQLGGLPRLTCNLQRADIRTIIWATGYRPDHGWLKLPVFDARGRIAHRGGLVAPGLYVIGLPFQRRRNSALLDGVGADAQFLADHIAFHRGRMAA